MTTEQRNRLVEAHLDLAPRMVKFMMRNSPASLDYGDLISIAMLALIRCADKAPRGVNFRNYACTSIKHAIIDEIKRIKQQSHREPSYDQFDFLHAFCGTDDTILALKRMEADYIYSLLPNLIPRQGDVMRMYYRDGLTMPEIAQVMRCNKGRISTWHRRAIDKIRELAGEQR